MRSYFGVDAPRRYSGTDSVSDCPPDASMPAIEASALGAEEAPVPKLLCKCGHVPAGPGAVAVVGDDGVDLLYITEGTVVPTLG